MNGIIRYSVTCSIVFWAMWLSGVVLVITADLYKSYGNIGLAFYFLCVGVVAYLVTVIRKLRVLEAENK